MKTNILIIPCILMGASFLTGCATNPFAQYYQTYTNQWPVAVQQRLLPTAANPQIVNVAPANTREEARRLLERNMICVGFSSFHGGAAKQQQLVEQAKRVGADVVLFVSQYSHTEQGVRPVLNYHPGETYTTTEHGTANANIYGSGGYAYGSGTYSGYSTTTSSGTFDTQYVPYQMRVYDYGASLRRVKPGIFGARVLPIPEAMRSTLQRNTGALVDVVMLDSPAFRANILRGDIIIQIADKPIAMPKDFISALPSYAGQKVTVRVMRGSQTLDIDVQLAESE